VLPIVFGLLTSLCFAIASLLAQRGYARGPAPWGAWITIAGNCALLLAAHFALHSDTRFSPPTISFSSRSACWSPE
jgi:hypothetical protein